MPETTYMADRHVHITSGKVKLEGAQYPLPDINSAFVWHKRTDYFVFWEFMFLLAGVVVFSAALVLDFLKVQSSVVLTTQIVGIVLLVMWSLLLMLSQVLKRRTYAYVVRLRTRSGTIEALSSQRKDYADKVASAVNEAVGSGRR